ncbi:MAG: hypothetical protein FJ117_11550 [Deltaproteobacteria bacterium]|nr:hypothetical protein [Deltaproteobacteria bacterium]
MIYLILIPMIAFRQNILRRIANFSYGHYKPVLLCALILASLSGFLVSRLQFQSDVVNLLPANAPTTSAFVKFLKEFGSADSLFIVLERKSGYEVESFAPFAEILAERLMATGEFREIHGWASKTSETKTEEQFASKALLYLTDEELRALEIKLTDTAIEERVRALKVRLHSPFGSLTSHWAIHDPLDLWHLFKNHIPSGGRIESHGYLLSEDRKMMLLIGKPRGSAPDVRYDEMLRDKVRSAEQAAREMYQGKKIDPPLPLQDLKVGLTGGYMHALEDSRMIKKDLAVNFSASLTGVMILFFLAFRRLVAFSYALFPLLASPLLTLGLLSPFLGRLSESTGAFSAIILGLSIDFIILLYFRYLEERNAGHDVLGALEICLSRTGPGVFTGAITTAVAYYALLLSDFRGVKELGLLTGTGILLSMLGVFFLFPALIAWREKKEKKVKPFRLVSSFGLERLSVLSLKRPYLILVICAAMTLGAIKWAFEVELNNDPRRLRPDNHASLILEERIQAKMGEGQDMIVVLTTSKNAEEALEIQSRLQAKFAEAKASGLPVTRYESLSSFLPPLSRQSRNLQWIEAREKGEFNYERVRKKFLEALKREGLQFEPFEPSLNMVQKMLANRELLTWEVFQQAPLQALGDRFLKKKGDAFVSAAYLHVRADFFANPQTKSFMSELQSVTSEIQITGSKLVQWELENMMSGEARKVLLIALTGVFLLIFLDFRSLRLTFLSLLPVVLASLWTLSLMGLFQMNLNFMNLIVFSMVLGVGVDYGIHILHRGLESGASRLETGLAQAGKGVGLSALTTLVGFGSLVLSGYPGLQSMGAVALMGVGFSALISLTLLPVLLQKLLQKRGSS